MSEEKKNDRLTPDEIDAVVDSLIYNDDGGVVGNLYYRCHQYAEIQGFFHSSAYEKANFLATELIKNGEDLASWYREGDTEKINKSTFEMMLKMCKKVAFRYLVVEEAKKLRPNLYEKLKREKTIMEDLQKVAERPRQQDPKRQEELQRELDVIRKEIAELSKGPLEARPEPKVYVEDDLGLDCTFGSFQTPYVKGVQMSMVPERLAALQAGWRPDDEWVQGAIKRIVMRKRKKASKK